MEKELLIGGIAVLCGFAAAYVLAFIVAAGLRRKSAAMASQGDSGTVKGLVAWRFRNGFRIALPLADLLLRFERVNEFADDAVDMVQRHGIASSRRALLSVLVVAMVVTGALAGVLAGGVAGAFACPACLVCVLVAVVGNAKDKRQEEVREAVPGALESMAACLGSGFTLLQTFRQVADDTPGALGDTFSQSAHILEVGGSAEESLANLRQGAHSSELAFVAVALDVQHQSGGAMRQVLDAATDTVKGELALRRSLRVQTAQAKLSARVVAIMPFILVAAFSLASPDFLSPFFASVAGYALLSLAVIMQVAGVMLVRRALAVDGVS